MKLFFSLLALYFFHLYLAISGDTDGLLHLIVSLGLGLCVCLRFGFSSNITQTCETREDEPYIYSSLWI